MSFISLCFLLVAVIVLGANAYPGQETQRPDRGLSEKAPTMASATDLLRNKTIYFGYGSNLWLHQMALRCPTSSYLGIARLNGYRWHISQRGYANVVKTTKKDYVYGLVYSLEQEDEDRLDVNEGVPIAYEKAWLECDFWRSESAGTEEVTGNPDADPAPITTEDKSETVDMLVYISYDKTKDSKPKTEYIYRMNMGIHDAIKMGVPKDYVEKYLRPFIPELDDHGEEVKKLGLEQALLFQDERED